MEQTQRQQQRLQLGDLEKRRKTNRTHRYIKSVAVKMTEGENHLGGGVDKVFGEPQVGFLEVGLDASRWLNRHLGTILENGRWELVAGKTREPQSKVFVHLRSRVGISGQRIPTNMKCSAAARGQTG